MKRTKQFISLGAVLLSVSLIAACGAQNSKTASTSNDEKTVATSNSSKEANTFDTPVVTDDAIESMRTYADYIDLYKKIFDDYFTKAEESFKGTAMENNESFTKLKESTQKLFDAQKKIYDLLGSTEIKEDDKSKLSQQLKDFRDNLQKQLKTLTSQLQ